MTLESEYRQMASALSNTVDKHLLSLAILASQASATITGTNGGTEITDADVNTNATSLFLQFSKQFKN